MPEMTYILKLLRKKKDRHVIMSISVGNGKTRKNEWFQKIIYIFALDK